MEKKNAWEKYPEGTKRQDVFTFAEEYRKFISSCKTERECAAELYRKAKEAGFADLSEKIAQNTKLKAGDRIVANNMDSTDYRCFQRYWESGGSVCDR